MIKFINAKILKNDELQETPLTIENNRIIEDSPQAKEINLNGYIICPGIIDLHGDSFDRHLAARRGALPNMIRGYWAVDAEFGVNGITTAYLAQFFSWEGGMRGPEFCEKMLHNLEKTEGLVTDIYVQLRLETSLIDEFEKALSLIDRFKISYVVLNDHLPRDALRKGKTPPRLNGIALRAGRSPEAHLKLMQALLKNEPHEWDALIKLTSKLKERKVKIGSHDDSTGAIRKAYRELHADISEFPETIEAAETAFNAHEPVIIGAPNIVRGASHNGNVSARELLTRTLISALVSDYHYPSLLEAIRVIDNEGLLPFAHAWKFISENPAKIMGFEDRGALKAGMRADYVVINENTYRIEGTAVAGKWSFLSNELADRILK